MQQFHKQLIFVASLFTILIAGGLGIRAVGSIKIDPSKTALISMVKQENTTSTTNNPVGWWKMDESLGDGTYLDLNATYYGQASNNTIHDITTEDISISAWVKVDVDAGSYQTVAFKGDSTLYSFYIHGGKIFIYTKYGSITYYVYSSTAILDNKWHHITGIIDRDTGANCKIFLDGIDNTSNRVGAVGDITTLANSGIFNVGYGNGGTWRVLDGQIRDVKLYYAAGDHWSDAEVLYQAQHPFDVSASAGTMTDYWRLDEGTGTTLTGGVNNLTLSSASAWGKETDVLPFIYDASGNGNTGILGPADSAYRPTWSSGKLGRGLSFDGVDDYVDAGNVLNQTINDFTISGWIKSASTAVTLGIINKRSYSATNNAGYVVQLESDNKLHIYFCDGTTIRIAGVSNSVFADSAWHFFSVTFDRDGVAQIYKDGIANGSVSISAQQGSLTNAVNFTLGVLNNGIVPANYFNGLIDDIRIYSRALSATEIAQMYNSTKDGYLGNIKMSSGLIGYWRMDEASWATTTNTTPVKDYSGNNNNGTPYNHAGMVAGQIGTAGSFDGTDDYINATGTISSTVRVLSFWAKPNSTTQKLIELSASDYVSLSAGVVSVAGFGTPTIYVDGALTTSFPNTDWHYITILSSTNLTANTVNFGKNGATYYNGLLDDIKIYSKTLTATEIQNDFVRGSLGKTQ